MYEDFCKRMERKGTYMGEIMRRQSDTVVDALWMNSISTRPVQVKVVNQGLPPTYESADDFEDVLWAHFEEHNKFNVTKDEQDCYLTFRPGELVQHPEIKPGSYVCVPNVDNKPEWWLIMYIDNDNELRKTQILKCNWVFKWVANGSIYQTLGCQRVANSYNSGSWDADRLTFVDSIMSAWLPTNKDTQTIGYNQRMLISDEGRYPPIAWQVSKIAWCKSIRTVRCIGKPCSVFLRIAGKPLEFYKLQHKDEIKLCVNVKNYRNWVISR